MTTSPRPASPSTPTEVSRSTDAHGHSPTERAAPPASPEPAPATRGGRWSLVAVTLVSLGVNSWGLGRNGLGNEFYTAGTRSMAASWHNFFYNSFDPGGFITVDKPPVAQWIIASSVRTFGFSSWSLLLPSAVAGAASVALLWSIVHRRFGPVPATIAGLVLALTPISVSVNRLNLPEPFMILFLLGAAWAVLRALDAERPLPWLALAGGFVGIAFNTKMLAAYIPVPALGLTILAATAGSIGKRILHGTTFGLTAIAASLPWILIVDHVSPSSRPYIGGSTNNTAWNLVFGYNGFGRIDGNGQGGGGRGGFGGGGLGGPGGVFGGAPGALRMFNDAVGGQIAWLLPLSAVLLVAAVWHHRRSRLGLAVIGLFAGWLLLYGVVFSEAAGTFHSYYTSAMAPALALLVGVGASAVFDLARRHAAWLVVAAGGLAVTYPVQRLLSGRAPSFYDWAVPVFAVAALVAVAVVAFSFAAPVRWRSRLLGGGLAIALAGATLAPAGWAVSESSNAVLNSTLPQAGPRGGAAGQTFGSPSSQGDDDLAAWLRAQRHGERWALVVTSAQSASGLIAGDDVPVLALGGFLGSDPAATVDSFAALVAAGKVRFAQPTGGFGPGGGFPGGGGIPNLPTGGFPSAGRGRLPTVPAGGPPGGLGPGGFPGGGAFGGGTAQQIMQAVRSVCEPITSTTANRLPASESGRIYDCAGKGSALAAAG